MTSINSIRTVRCCRPYCDLLGLRKNSPFVSWRLEPHYIQGIIYKYSVIESIPS